MFTPHESPPRLQDLYLKIRQLEERIIALEEKLTLSESKVHPTPYNMPDDDGFPPNSPK